MKYDRANMSLNIKNIKSLVTPGGIDIFGWLTSFYK